MHKAHEVLRRALGDAERMGLVRAAYSAGKPAYGVGPGNAPAYIERSADTAKAVRDIVTGKTFDNGVLCSSENSVVVDEAVAETVKREFQALFGFGIEGRCRSSPEEGKLCSRPGDTQGGGRERATDGRAGLIDAEAAVDTVPSAAERGDGAEAHARIRIGERGEERVGGAGGAMLAGGPDLRCAAGRSSSASPSSPCAPSIPREWCRGKG